MPTYPTFSPPGPSGWPREKPSTRSWAAQLAGTGLTETPVG